MRKLIFGIVVPGVAWLATPAPVQADIGDTMPELRQHYGSAKDMGGQMLFEVRLQNGRIIPARGAPNTETHFTVTVYFDGLHSAMEVFTRNTSDPAKADMTEQDINTILAAIGNGVAWVPVQTPSSKRTWVWGDQKGQPPKLLARFDPNKAGGTDDASVLVIMEYTEK